MCLQNHFSAFYKCNVLNAKTAIMHSFRGNKMLYARNIVENTNYMVQNVERDFTFINTF